MSRAKKTGSDLLGSRELLSFAEAAVALGVDSEKVRRLVVEDMRIGVVCVDRGGRRKSIDLLGMLADGAWRVDEGGRLCAATPCYEQSKLVGLSYVPLDVGELRIEHSEIERFREGLQAPTSAATAGRQQPAATRSTDEGTVIDDLPPGLGPEEVAEVFAGIGGVTEVTWRARLSRGDKTWLNRPPVVIRPGKRGKGQGGKPIVALRNPVKMADYLLRNGKASLAALNRAFRRPAAGQWRANWDAYYEDKKDFMGDR